MNTILKTNQKILDQLQKVNLTNQRKTITKFRCLLKNLIITLIRHFQKERNLQPIIYRIATKKHQNIFQDLIIAKTDKEGATVNLVVEDYN